MTLTILEQNLWRSWLHTCNMEPLNVGLCPTVSSISSETLQLPSLHYSRHVIKRYVDSSNAQFKDKLLGILILRTLDLKHRATHSQLDWRWVILNNHYICWQNTLLNTKYKIHAQSKLLDTINFVTILAKSNWSFVISYINWKTQFATYKMKILEEILF